MSDENHIEEHMLIEVHHNLGTLELDDGSKWSIEPGGIPSVYTWLPTTTIGVELVTPKSGWPYKLTNIGDGVSVRAAQI